MVTHILCMPLAIFDAVFFQPAVSRLYSFTAPPDTARLYTIQSIHYTALYTDPLLLCSCITWAAVGVDGCCLLGLGRKDRPGLGRASRSTGERNEECSMHGNFPSHQSILMSWFLQVHMRASTSRYSCIYACTKVWHLVRHLLQPMTRTGLPYMYYLQVVLYVT